MSVSSPLIILPCAGFGRRVGSPESKEMSLDQSTEKPLIESWLSLARSLSWPVHVITRRQKKNLINYLQSAQTYQEISLQLIEPSREWPDTILRSEPFWRSGNILALPDTKIAPSEILQSLFEALETSDVVYGTIEKQETQTFGVVKINKQASELVIYEKCAPPEQKKVWGIVGFRKNVGVTVWSAHLESTLENEPRLVKNIKATERPLKFFADLTRA